MGRYSLFSVESLILGIRMHLQETVLKGNNGSKMISTIQSKSGGNIRKFEDSFCYSTVY